MSLFFKNTLRRCIDTLIFAESFLHTKQKPLVINNQPQKRVLIMRKDGLGDCIIFYPTLRAYRDYYKNAEITLIFPTYFKDLAPLLSKELVDKVVWFDHKLFGSSFSYRRRFLLDLKRGGYDIFIYPVYSRETIGFFMMKMTGAHERIGFDGDISGRGKLAEKRGTLAYTRLIKVPDDMKSEMARNAFLAETITGNKPSLSFPTIDIRKLPDVKAVELMQKYDIREGNYAVVFPGAGAHYRIWQTENFAHACDHINSRGITVVLCGSPKETNLVKGIMDAMQSKQNAIDLSGQTDLATLAHLLARARFYFGSDTGILHLAAAVNTPTVAVMGMGGLERFFPYGDLARNRIIFDRKNTYPLGAWTDFEKLAPGEIHPSIRNITIEDARAEIDSLLQYLS